MKYAVALHRDPKGRSAGWGIWDYELSPKLEAGGFRPWCGLKGKELVFTSFSAAWGWLALCAAEGLDMGPGGMTAKVRPGSPHGGTVVFRKESLS